jgi:hypothetical protein
VQIERVSHDFTTRIPVCLRRSVPEQTFLYSSRRVANGGWPSQSQLSTSLYIRHLPYSLDPTRLVCALSCSLPLSTLFPTRPSLTLLVSDPIPSTRLLIDTLYRLPDPAPRQHHLRLHTGQDFGCDWRAKSLYPTLCGVAIESGTTSLEACA